MHVTKLMSVYWSLNVQHLFNCLSFPRWQFVFANIAITIEDLCSWTAPSWIPSQRSHVLAGASD